MYKLHLIRKYLLKRRIAWVALVAVTLCTAMVLVVVSVMGGWLRMFLDSFHGMTGDVVITSESLTGFPYYQDMINGVLKLPDVAGAVPIIRSGALLNIDNRTVEMVQLLGYPPNIGTVNDFESTLHMDVEQRRREIQAAMAQPGISPAERERFNSDLKELPFSLHPFLHYENYLRHNAAAARNRPAMIVCSRVLMEKDKGPEADELRQNVRHWPVTLTMVPVVGGEALSVDSVQPVPFWIVDDSHSRIWQLDNNNVYISFDEAQKDLRMAATDSDPARCSEVQIKAKPGTNLDQLKAQVMQITDSVRQNHTFEDFYDFKVQTWQEQQGAFIHAVQNEVVLTTALFGIISMVAVLLIFCIFYMIVVEKTKDIGIIKSVGATGPGILALFLGYGLAIGLVGAAMGFSVAFVIVRYINEIHAWLGRVTGHPIWTAETYQFDKIPSSMETSTVMYVLLVAVLSAVLGALLPAIRAAMMNPVDALRYE